ncbi:MAG: hypothetical protein EON93_14990, partial [Burkholderiales bacterium]
MMRLPALAVMVLAVTACGESKPPLSAEHVEYTKLCVDAGGDRTHCECQATKVDELTTSGEINPKVREALILQAQGKEDEADAIMLALPYN